MSSDPRSAAWNPDWTLAPAPKGDDEHFCEALYEAQVRTLGKDAIQQPAWDELPEWKRESWRREYRNV